MRKGGGDADEIDIVHGADHDITQRKVLHRILRNIRKHNYSSAMLAIPCTTFSRARRSPKPGMPGPLRSSEEPWGLTTLTGRDQEKLDLGNAITRCTLRIVVALERYKIPYIVENPQTSILWWLPEF